MLNALQSWHSHSDLSESESVWMKLSLSSAGQWLSSWVTDALLTSGSVTPKGLGGTKPSNPLLNAWGDSCYSPHTTYDFFPHKCRRIIVSTSHFAWNGFKTVRVSIISICSSSLPSSNCYMIWMVYQSLKPIDIQLKSRSWTDESLHLKHAQVGCCVAVIYQFITFCTIWPLNTSMPSKDFWSCFKLSLLRTLII